MDRLLLPLLIPIDVWCFWTYTQALHKDINSVALPWLYLGFLVGPCYLVGKHFELHGIRPLPRVAIGFSCLVNAAITGLIWRFCTHNNYDYRLWYPPRVYLLADTCLVLLISLLCYALVQILAAPPANRCNAATAVHLDESDTPI